MTTSIQEYSKADAALADLAQRFKGVVFDVTTTSGMQAARVARAELRGYRVGLEKTRVEIKAPALERCRLIDAEARRITAALTELEDPIDAQIKSEEKRKEREAMERVMAEQRRVDAIKARIATLQKWPSACVGKTGAQIAAVLADLRAQVIGDDFAEFKGEAEEVLRNVIAQVDTMCAGAEAQEAESERIKAERAELARLRAESEARDRAAREALEAEQRAARAQIEEEQRVAREAQRAEDARLAAERARIDAERREAEAARREVERKEADLADAREMLALFVSRFGHIAEFSVVVAAIKSLKAPKRKAA